MKKVALILLILFQINTACAQQLVLVTTTRSPVYVAVETKIALECRVNEADFITLRWTDEKSTVMRISNTTELVLVFDRIKYSNEGVYYCQAVNQTSGVIVAQANVTVNVGEPPPVPPPPTLKRVCGYPPNEVMFSYQYNSPTHSTHYPVIVELLLAHISGPIIENPYFTSNDNFTIVEKSRRTIHRSENVSFEVNVSDSVDDMFPKFPYCSKPGSMYGCSLLCASVRTTNAFGTRFGKTKYENLVSKAKCGKVDDLRVGAVGRNSITLAWNVPLCMTNTSKPNVYYWVWCEKPCGSKIMIKFPIEDDNAVATKTIDYLEEFTNNTFFVSCALTRDFLDAGEKVSISVQTKEGVPSYGPNVKTMYWLSQCSESNVLNNTALVSWTAPDKEDLHGIIRHYVITYQTDHNMPTSTRKIRGDKLQAEIPGLRMEQGFNFTITVCTGGGCSKPSQKYFLSPAKCKTPVDLEVKDGHKSGLKTYWILTVLIGGCVTLLAIICIVMYSVNKHRNATRVNVPPLPSCQDISPGNHSFSSDDDITTNDYAYAGNHPVAFANEVELRNSDSCLSQTSIASILTHNTDI